YLCREGFENATNQAVTFSGFEPEFEQEKDGASGLELEELRMKLDEAFSPRILPLLGLSSRTYRAVAFAGSEPEFEREKDRASGLEHEELGMKLDEAFSPQILPLLGLSSRSSKPQQHVRVGHGKIGEYLCLLGLQGSIASEFEMKSDALLQLISNRSSYGKKTRSSLLFS
ncbi:hypothetical protein Taro_017449, partial [Colocasia esculenta]|nr:hypothetical protein [Colocasia esculenta]